MFKYLGQHIFDFISKFRNDVYFQNLEELEHNFSIVIGPDGKLAKSKGPAEKSIIEVRNDEGSVIPAGAPLYSKGEIGGSDRIKVGICDATDPAKMPCIGIAQYEMNTSDTKDNFAITQGVYNTNITGFTGLSEGDTLYVNGGAAPYLTSTKPSNGNYIQNVGIVLKTNGTICQGLLVSAIGRTNDVPWPLYVDVANGKVGIGTTNPSEKLDVVGNIKASGTIKGKMEQMFACSFSDDLGTTKHFIPFTSNAEQTNVHADQVAMVMPYGGRVKCIQMRLSNIDADTTRTLGIESIAPGVNMFQNAGNWTSEETEAYELVASDDYYLINYVFSNETHFDSGDLMAISIQDSEDAHTTSRQIYMNVIVEYDLNNGMGNDTATTKYTS